MSYENQNDLNDLDPSTPLDGASYEELLLAVRQLKAIVKNVLLASHEPGGVLLPEAVELLGANTVNSEQLVDGSVTVEKLAPSAVEETALADGAVTEAKLAAQSVTEEKYAPASIPTEAFQLDSIPLEALNSLITRAFLSGHATVDELRAVTELVIADNAVVDRAVKDVDVSKLTGGANGDLLVKVDGTWTAYSLGGGMSFDPIAGFSFDGGIKASVLGDVKSRGSNGGAATAGAWNTRSLGEIADPFNLTTFSANKFKLIAGKYLVFFSCPASAVGKHQAALVNVTDGVVAAYGTSEQSPATNAQNRSIIIAVLDIDAGSINDEYRIEHYIENNVGSTDLGVAASSANGSAPHTGVAELFTFGFVVKI